MKTYLFIAVIGALSLFSCKKDKNEGPVEATIEFLEPNEGDTILFSGSLHAEGTIKATGNMHGFEMIIKNESSNEIIYQGNSVDQNDAYAFHEHWVNNVADTSTVSIQVSAIIDPEGNKTTKQVNVVCLPQ